MGMDQRPAFFQIMRPGLTSQPLCIPSEFLKHIERDLSNRATLKGPSGSSWSVQVTKTPNGVYLDHGWLEFLKDNSLGNNEFVIFTHEGNMCFSARIFSKSGCERVAAANHIAKNQQPEPSNRKRKRGKPQEHPSPALHPGRVQRKTEKHVMGVNVNPLQGTNHPSSREDATRSRVERSSSAESFTSKFPHFRKTMTSSSAYNLSIPTLFSREHLASTRSEMILRTTNVARWVVNCTFSRKRHFFSAGWVGFTRENNLKEGDVCVFELVGKQEMQVHIFPH